MGGSFSIMPCVSPILLFLLIHVSVSCADPSLYAPFLQCLTNHTRPSQSHHISHIIFDNTNVSYTSVLQNYIRNARFNTSSTPKPSLIVTPLQESHVQAAVMCARSLQIQIKIRGGCHDYVGISYVSRHKPFIILDLFNLRNISLDILNEVAVVQSGATIGELYYRIWEKSKVHAFPGGVCPTMGVEAI